jgi:hypothetical protein
MFMVEIRWLNRPCQIDSWQEKWQEQEEQEEEQEEQEASSAKGKIRANDNFLSFYVQVIARSFFIIDHFLLKTPLLSTHIFFHNPIFLVS